MAIRDNAWQTIMLKAVHSLGVRYKLTIAERARLARSITAPIKEQEPFDLFTSYLFERHFGDF